MQLQRIRMFYDPRGQVIRTLNPDGSEQRVLYGVPADLENPDSYVPTPWETYNYDASDLDSGSPYYGTPKSALSDAMGRNVKSMDRLENNSSTSNNVQMQYTYDIRGNLLLVKDAYDRLVYEHVYDLRPKQKEDEALPPLKTVHINKGTSKVVYDCTGNPVEERDNKGALSLSSYDIMQRPLKRWSRDIENEDVTLRQRLVYGSDHDNNNKSELLQHFDESGYRYTGQYDFKGNPLLKIQQTIANSELLNTVSESEANGWEEIYCYRVNWENDVPMDLAYETSMEYDALNRLMRIVYPLDANDEHKEMVPEYNRSGALKRVLFNGEEYVQHIAYNAKGQRLLISYGNGLMTRYTYNDQTFRLIRMRTERYTYTEEGNRRIYEYNAGTCKQDFGYTYDKTGNILSIKDETPKCGVGGTDELERAFEYDALYRLLQASGRENQPENLHWADQKRSYDPNTTTAYTQQYTYDLMGNMNELNHIGSSSFTRTYHHNNNLLEDFESGGNTFYYEYDACSNQVMENEERHMQWDHDDRMRLFYNQTNPGNVPSIYTHYLYDSAGNRVKKLTWKDGGLWETSIYIDGLIDYRENNASERQSISYISDDTKRIASVREGNEMGDLNPAVKYNLDDHLGSSSLSVTADYGTLIRAEEYYPFGETSFGSYTKKRYRFCGKEKDEESGMYYYGARYYSPWLCRFVSVDPIASDYPIFTPFQYAANKPINNIDLDGLEAIPNGNTDPLIFNADMVDMSKAPSKFKTASGRWFYTTKNALGEKRNLAYYWSEVMKKHPEYFDKENTERINKGMSPKVNKTWIKYHKSHAPWLRQKLEHHHLDHEKIAIGIPEGAHRRSGNYKLWHHKLSKLSGVGKKLNGFIPFDITDVSGYLAKRPDSFFMELEGLWDPKVGVVYSDVLDQWEGKYFIIREKTETKDAEGNVISTTFVTDFYDRLVDGYQELDEDSFINQRTYTVDRNGEPIT